jgi:hypothetical protein
MAVSWLSSWRRVQPGRPAVRRVRLRLEALEDRRVPVVFNPLPSTPDGAPGSLRADIIAANANGQDNTINLQQGHYLLTLPNTAGQEDAAATGDLDLTSGGHTITIQGAGAGLTVIDALGIDRVFQVVGNFQNTGNVTAIFSNLTITGGRATDDGTAGVAQFTPPSLGGGILNSGGNVTLDHVVVEHNVALGVAGTNGAGTRAEGGGIWSDGALIINDSTIQNNEAIGGNGSGVSAQGGEAGGGGLAASGTVSLTHATIQDNEALGGSGGNGANPAGVNGGTGGVGAGGGLAVSGTISLTNTTIEGNEALGGPGGNGADGNSTNPAGGTGGAGGAGQGGGLSFGDGSLTADSTTLSTNLAMGGAGGNGGAGFFAGPIGSVSGGNGGDGGAAAGGGLASEIAPSPPEIAEHFGDSIVLSNSTVADNTTIGGGGGTGGTGPAPGTGGDGGSSEGGGIVANLAGTTTISNSTVAFNRAAMSHGGASAMVYWGAGNPGIDQVGDGGGLYHKFGFVSVISSIFGDNTAEGGSNVDISGDFHIALHVLLANNTGSNLAAGLPDANGNLVGTAFHPLDPRLQPLGNYGGPTQTIALYPDSPAIGAGLNPDQLATDQRGLVSRTVQGATDIGAFELGATTTPPLPTVPAAAPIFHALTARLVRVHHQTRLDVFDAVTGALRRSVFPFGTSRGQVQLFRVDVNGDGVSDIVVVCRQNNHLRMRAFSGTDLNDLTALLS